MLVNDRHGRLGLWGKVYTLCHNCASIGKNVGFITVYITLAFILGIKKQVKGRIFILEIELQHFFAVVCFCTVRLLYGQCIFQSVLNISGIIVRVGIFFIQDILDIRILRGHDLQTTTVKQVLCLGLGISFDIHQIIDNLFVQLILKVRVYLTLGLGIGNLSFLNTGVNIIIQSFIVLLLCDVSLSQHMVQNFFPPLGIFLGILNRIVFGRSLCDTCKSCTFGKVQIPYIFIEILTCRSLNSICTGTKVDSV